MVESKDPGTFEEALAMGWNKVEVDVSQHRESAGKMVRRPPGEPEPDFCFGKVPKRICCWGTNCAKAPDED